MSTNPIPVEAALRALGAELRSRGERARLLVVGGASLVLQGFTPRLTGDVDVIAALDDRGALVYPAPISEAVSAAARDVQRTLGLDDPDWLNATVATSWAHRWPEGLPPDLLVGVEWRTYGTLEVGLVGRAALVLLKVHAVVDRAEPRFDSSLTEVLSVDLTPTDASRKHLGDLTGLAPTDGELDRAAAWVLDQDTSPHMTAHLDAVRTAVRDARG
jgi:hypothetical protein